MEELRPNLIEETTHSCNKHFDSSPCHNRGYFRGSKFGFELALSIMRTEMDAHNADFDSVHRFWSDQSANL